MEAVNILDARNHLSSLVARAQVGEEVIIARRGEPVVRLVPLDRTPAHSAEAAALWIAANPVPVRGIRSVSELDEQITREREGWE